MDLLCLIPARGGSKTVKRKNLRVVEGRTLIQIAVEACLPHGRTVVSTDDKDIAAVARMCGAEVWDRPAHLAGDSASVDDLVQHTRVMHRGPLLVFQPTVPQAACVLSLFVDDWRKRGGSPSMGTEHRHIVWQDGHELTPRAQRQDLAPLVDEIGVRLYAAESSVLDRVWLSPLPLVDIDTPADLQHARSLMSSKRILFRVLANRQVGSGHVRRCVQLADELQHHLIGFTAVEGSDGLVESLCDYPLVPDDWPRDVCVNDILDTSEAEMFRLRSLSPVLALEDLGPGAQHASLVINELYPAHARRELCGPDYAVLRPVFTAVPEHRFDHWGPPRLLVTFGGTDPSGLTGRLHGRSEWDTIVVPPPVQGGNTDIASLLCWADLVVCSGGRTVWEAMRCGTPALVLCQNPRELSHSHLTAAYGVLNLGLGRLASDGKILRHLTVLLNDRALLAEMSARMRNVVDGKGVRRIVGQIESMLGGL